MEKKLLFIGEFAGFAGGIERYMAHCSDSLRKNGFIVDVATNQNTRGAEDFRAHFNHSFDWSSLDSIAHSYDYAVIHKIREGAVVANLRRRCPVAVFLHDHEFYCPRRSYYHPFTECNCHLAYARLRCTLCGMLKRPKNGVVNDFKEIFVDFPNLFSEIRQANRFIVLSDFMRDCAIRNGFAADNIRKIPPAIDLPQFLPPKEETAPLHLLVSGQLIRGKGIDQLIAAAALIKTPCEIDILGTGNAEERLKAMAQNSPHPIHFHAWSNEPETFLQNAAIAVLPWRWQEPFGLVGAEALANGVPLVGFSVGGSGEYLINGQTGIAVPPKAVDQLAEAIDTLLNDASLRHTLGTTGRKLVAEKLTEAALVSGYQRLFD